MATASPDTIGTVVSQIAQEMADLAAQQGQGLRDILDNAAQQAGQAPDEVKKLTDDAVQQIKSLVDPPDWWSILVFALIELRRIDPDHLSIGTLDIDGWSRMVTLTYTVDAATRFTLGLAITDPDKKKGILLDASTRLDKSFGSGDDLRIAFSSTGAGRWRYPIGGAVELPDTDAVLHVDVAWKAVPDIPAVAGFEFTVGALHLHAKLAKNPPDPLYVLSLGWGDSDNAGLGFHLRTEEALGPVLSKFITIADPSQAYAPQVTLTAGQSPQFTLGPASP